MANKKSYRPANPDQERIEGIKKRYKFAEDYWQKQYELMAEDIKHLNPETQFPDGTREARMGLPTLAVDRLNTAIHSIVNSQRQNLIRRMKLPEQRRLILQNINIIA